MNHAFRRRILALALLHAFAASAQDAPAPAADASRVYLPADFARFAPRNALEMLRQVPGFVIREAVQERGFGEAGGNVVINGERVSGKSNDVVDTLTRIPADNVVRIEIVDAATLDVPGLSGQVANVIARADTIRGQWSWRPEFRKYYTEPLLTRGDVSVSGTRGALQYTLGFENGASRSGAGGGTTIYNADRSLREVRDDEWTGEYDAPKLTSRLVYDAPGSSIATLNASYQRVYYDFVENGLRTGPGLPDRERVVEVGERGYNYEVGGDYEFGLGAGRLKLIGLDRFGHTPATQAVRVTPVDGGVSTGSRFERESDERERIARGEYRWKTGSTDWQISAEAAYNSLDSTAALSVLDAAGAYVPVALPGSTAKVEEDRYEVMGSYGRPLTPALSLQASAGGEYSKLSQAGGGGLTRAFTRPKGSIALAWKASPDLDVNARLSRRVGQLNFYDFLATVNLSEERENAGNPDLVPPQSWEFDVEATRRLGAWGSTSLRLYAHRVDDIVDTVPIGADGESPGNIDRATRHGMEWKGTFNFDPIGWRGAKLDARFQAQDTAVSDPLTGEDRRISGSLIRFWQLGLRHDVHGTSWAWGSNVSHEEYARNVRLTEDGHQWEGPRWASVFVEHKDVFGLTVRATAGNLLGARSYYDRTAYLDRRGGPVDFYEDRDRRIGPIFSFSVSGKF
jgi:hypothetical protein